MATRLASICRSVIQPGSSTFSPKSPKASVDPRHALPVMRPRCCLRYFTFFGINIKVSVETLFVTSRYIPCRARCAGRDVASNVSTNLTSESASHRRLRLAFLGRQDFPFVDPAFHSDHSIGGARLGEAVVDVGAQGMQRQPALQVPFRARDFVAVQPSAYADLDSFAAKTQRRIHQIGRASCR